jgi:CDP-diglyceride synthetase
VLRTRALSAIVLVPVLLVALWLGLWAIAAILVLVAILGGIEVFRLLRGAGYPSLPLFGTALAVAFVLAS